MSSYPVDKYRPGFYFSVRPMTFDPSGEAVEVQVTHALEVQSANSYPSDQTFDDPQDALRAGCQQLLGIHQACGPLAGAHMYRISVHEGESCIPIFAVDVYRGALICARCGDTVRLAPALTEGPAEAGFEYDRKTHKVVYAERRQVGGVVCGHCRCASEIEDCILGFDMTASDIGIRFVSVREIQNADVS